MIKRWVRRLHRVVVVVTITASRVLAVLAVIYVIAFGFLFIKGKDIAVSQLEKATQKKVQMRYFRVVPPLNFKIKRLDIPGLMKADYIYISPSITRLMFGKIVFNNVRVIRPEFFFEKAASPEAQTQVAASPEARTQAAASQPAVPQKKPELQLVFKRIHIENGKINFSDRSVSPEAINVVVKSVNFDVEEIYPSLLSKITTFKLRGVIPWREGAEQGKIEAEGWLDPDKKNMQANLKISAIDAIYLHPYYAKWVDLKGARIESAKLNFTCDMQGLHNDLTVSYQLELAEIVRRQRAPEESTGKEKAEKITDAVLDSFKATDQGRVVLNYSYKTKMDKPEFSFGNIKLAFEEKLSRAQNKENYNVEYFFRLPGRLIINTINSATGVSRAVIDGTFSVGKELKNALEGAFKKDSPQPDNATANLTDINSAK